MWWLLAVVVIVVLLFAGVAAFNKLRRLDIDAQEALGGIDVQLTRRADLVPNLVETVRGYAAHEKGVLEEVTRARAAVSQATAGGTIEQRAEAAGLLDRALANVFAVAENYPDLKASANFLDLQRQLADTENQLAFARQFYNDAAGQLNTAIATVPTMFFVGIAGVSRRAFYTAPADDQAPPQVSFGG